VDELLETALDCGIRLLDTAPAYASSEARVGAWLRRLPAERQRTVIIATKCGEEWDEAAGVPFTDHSYDGLRRSIDRSLERLGRVDLLQIHKATPAVVTDGAVRRALEYGRQCGIPEFGVSAPDVETVRLAVADPFFSAVQFPFNATNSSLEEMLAAAMEAGKRVLLNRPYAMGGLLFDAEGRHRGEEAMVEAFRFVLARRFRGFVLTGTQSAAHLRANVSAFERAREER
jgi:aryl-alcohol dehydrogenase-like predicted oxidoreductase